MVIFVSTDFITCVEFSKLVVFLESSVKVLTDPGDLVSIIFTDLFFNVLDSVSE